MNAALHRIVRRSRSFHFGVRVELRDAIAPSHAALDGRRNLGATASFRRTTTFYLVCVSTVSFGVMAA